MLLANLLRLVAPLRCWSVKALGWIGGSALGGTFLCFIAAEVGPTTGTVIVHVTEPDVTVSIGGETFRIEERPYAPLVVVLPRGEYRLAMTRGDAVLYSAAFEVHGGADVVLTPWAPAADLHRASRADGGLIFPGPPP